MYLVSDWTTSRLVVSGTTDLFTDSWHHVVVSYDGSSLATGVNVYIDGAEEALSIGADSLSAGTMQDSAANFFVGGRDPGAFCLSAAMDDLQVYDFALSQTNASWLFSHPGEALKMSGDFDLDGLADAWEVEYFGSMTDPDAAWDADKDRDQYPNIDEYIAGTVPTNSDDALTVQGLYANGNYVVQYAGISAATPFYADKTRFYDLEYRTNLLAGTWTKVPAATNILGADRIERFANSTPDVSGFYRVRVRLDETIP